MLTWLILSLALMLASAVWVIANGEADYLGDLGPGSCGLITSTLSAIAAATALLIRAVN